MERLFTEQYFNYVIDDDKRLADNKRYLGISNVSGWSLSYGNIF